MKRVIEADKPGFLELLQNRRDEANATQGRRELPQTTRSRHKGITQGLDFAMRAVQDWRLPEPPKTWLYGLTADEWFLLASLGTESEVQPCCGNISQIRDLLQLLAMTQASYDGWLRVTIGQQLLEAISAEGKGDDSEHGLDDADGFPLLARVLTGIRAEIAELAANPLGMLPAQSQESAGAGSAQPGQSSP